jgi:ubiquinol-cytochrome c reductase cytochrome b subunit|uniref:Cytochrome b n=1 Tax=Telonemida sp. TaxID=2652706 RepID=A0A5P8DJZ1_9EUKA|nr:apocytochrome b [Telonemida sp.]
MKLLKRPIINIVTNHLVDYPTPINFNYWYNFGLLSGICLGIQILTGIFLAMHYTPHIDYAWLSVEHIMRDVNYGWLIRYMHANGASMFFIVVYVHLLRGLYYGSYKSPRGLVWCLGVVILILMMATGFIGYVLPWGQMSFWAATVITNLFSAIPGIGTPLVEFLWGGFAVDNATLNRFFSLHYLLPFVLLGLVLLHIAALHQEGSSNPLGLHGKDIDKIDFYPYFYVKDLFGFMVFTVFFSYFLFFDPNVLGHPDNYIAANPMVTPAHIVPEWYFLPYYAILRSIPDKLGGVIAMGASLVTLALLPLVNTSNVRSSFFRPLHRYCFWIWVGNAFVLGWIGGNPVEDPYILIGQLATVVYFGYLLVIIPGLGLLERVLIENKLDRLNNA